MPYRAVVLHGVGCTIGIIEEVNGIGSPGHAHELTAGIVVLVSNTIYRFTGSQAIGIVSKAQAVAASSSGCQVPTACPRHCPAGAVVVAGGVANGIVSKITPQRLLRIFVCLHNIRELLI